jgi:uncharacterized lipoprotein YmbA
VTGRRWLLLLASQVGLVGLVGCGWTPPPRLYTLVAVPGPVIDNAPRTVGLASVRLPMYLDRPQIVRSTDDVEMQLTEAERWAEPLPAMVERVLAQNLSQRLPGTTVLYGRDAIMLPGAPVIELNLGRFDMDSTGSVVLAAQAELRRGTTSGAVTRLAPRHTIAPRSRETRDMVHALSEALGRLADDLARMIVRGGARRSSGASSPPSGG